MLGTDASCYFPHGDIKNIARPIRYFSSAFVLVGEGGGFNAPDSDFVLVGSPALAGRASASACDWVA